MEYYAIHHDVIYVLNNKLEIKLFIYPYKNVVNYDEYIGCKPKNDNFDGSKSVSSKIRAYESLEDIYFENPDIAEKHKITMKFEEFEYIDGLLHGYYNSGYYDMGRKTGLWIEKTFDSERKLYYSNNFLNGEAKMTITRQEEYICHYKGRYVNNRKHGEWIIEDHYKRKIVYKFISYNLGTIINNEIKIVDELIEQKFKVRNLEKQEPCEDNFVIGDLISEIKKYNTGEIEYTLNQKGIKKIFRKNGTLIEENIPGQFKRTYYENGIDIYIEETQIYRRPFPITDIKIFNKNGIMVEHFNSMCYQKWDDEGNLIHEIDENFSQEKWNNGIKILSVKFLYKDVYDYIYSYDEYYNSGNIKFSGIVVRLSWTSIKEENSMNLCKKDNFIEYYENGNIKTTTFYSYLNLEGNVWGYAKNGEYNEYYENGNLKISGNYRNNRKVGRWIEYNNNGQEINNEVFMFEK